MHLVLVFESGIAEQARRADPAEAALAGGGICECVKALAARYNWNPA